MIYLIFIQCNCIQFHISENKKDDIFKHYKKKRKKTDQKNNYIEKKS